MKPNKISQERQSMKSKSLFRIMPALLAITLMFGTSTFGQEKARITITRVPSCQPGETMCPDPIKGTVAGAGRDQKLVIYAHGGDKWWVQPYAASPFTNISDNGQ